ncbi:Rhs family protein [Alishewanella aestuarii B11]|uniref:Rhs family protein n=2 Tax=Alishewanella aestuarii TaxID=453835 RepID=J2IIU8_9ALTE|nr:Rhs family protein [Alishewanella aestuarii B11]
MGGRVYDPILGRFLQADPFVQQPNNTPNLNRYSYVLNNPLNATDPSGYFFQMLAMWAAARQWQTLPEGWQRAMLRVCYLTAQ